MNATPRNEYPRPDFVRDEWISLNGEWKFSFEDEIYDRRIVVPYAYETKLSGIGETDFHDVVWYKRDFSLPESMNHKKIFLNFGAVDYICQVWVNNILVKEHIGGQISFNADITHAVRFDGDNILRVKVIDEHADLEKPRGKQFWESESRSIFYTHTTGIWQSVWLEAVSPNYLKGIYIKPILDERAVKFEYTLEGKKSLSLETVISFKGTFVTRFVVDAQCSRGSFTISLDQPVLKAWNFYEDLTWSPETPRLFDVIFSVYEGKNIEDVVTSYFGMRKVSIENGIFMLNNRPYYQKLLLDQGYWPDSLMTAPNDDAFVQDIMLVKQMGFNGVRKHQKVEDPRFLFHADRLGLLVWGEIGSAFVYSREYAARMYQEWTTAIERDYNHPSIVAWVPLNESWGIQEIFTNGMQQSHCNAMLFITKSIDDSRPVIDNDGWEHTCGDLLTIHDYESSKEILQERYKSLDNVLQFAPNGRQLFTQGWKYNGQPIIISEFGGISYQKKTKNGWGYSLAASESDFLERYYAVVDPLLKSCLVQGFCYTQLADVEQETNGLLTYCRKPKVDLEAIRKINDGIWKINSDPIV